MTLTPEKFASVFDDYPCGVCLVGPNGIIQRCNRTYAVIVGRRRQDLEGIARYQTLTHGEDVEADELATAQALAGNIHCYQILKRYVLPDGTPIPCSVVVFPLRDATGMVGSLLALVVDLSGSQRARILESLKDLELHNARVRTLLESADLSQLVAVDAGG